MEILIRENKTLRDSDLFFFENGFSISNEKQLEEARAFVLSANEESLFTVFNASSEEFNYRCQSSSQIDETERKRIAKRILYFVRCQENGSHEFVLCTNLVTKKEQFLKYVNGHFQDKLTMSHFQALIERRPAHLFRLTHGKFQVIGYTLNVGLDHEVLTKPIFSHLIQEDIKQRLAKLFSPKKRQPPSPIIKEDKLSYKRPIIKRFNDVVALSDFLVVTLEIVKDSYVLLREIQGEVFISFLNLDDEVFDIHLKVNSTRYARKSLINSSEFPLVIYLKYTSRVDLFAFLENEVEYLVDLEARSFEGNFWYRIVEIE